MPNPSLNIWDRTLGALRPAFIVVGLFSLFINLTMLVTPVYMMQVYDRVLSSQSTDTLLMLTLLAGALLALGAVVDAARSRLLVRVGADLDKRLSRPLFHGAFHIIPTPTAITEPLAASQPLRDFEKVRSFLTGSGILAFFDAPWVPVYLAVIFMFHPILGSIALGGAICIFLLALLSEYLSRKPLAVSGAEMHSARDFVDSYARNSDSVRAMGMLPALEIRWFAHHNAAIGWQAFASDRMAILQALAKMLRAGLQISILGVGAWLALNQSISAGAMVAASIIMGRALAPVEAAIAQWRAFIDARTALARLKQILSVSELPQEKVYTRLPAPAGRLCVENAGLKLAGVSQPILRGISFEVVPGEFIGLIGPSGAGKSSLARLIAGAIPPTVGTVRIDSADISEWPQQELGPYIGYLPQTVELFSGSVAENIARFGSHDSEDIIATAQLAGAHDMILSLPQGYETLVDTEGRNLAGGQRQRIGLARAIYGAARVIVLDEPNSNLDADGESALKTTLMRLKEQKRTVIAITHKPSLLAASDKLLVLREGALHMFGPRKTIMAALRQPHEGTSSATESDLSRPTPSAIAPVTSTIVPGGLRATR